MYKKILLAANFDEVGLCAAQKARELAAKFSADLHIVHVIEPLPAYAYSGFSGFADIEQSLKNNVKEQVRQLAADLGVAEDKCHLETGSIKNEVVRVANELNCDLIVAGSHAKHGFSLLLGSNANGILYAAESDVLLVRADQEA